MWPGIQLQRLTTREPDHAQLAVAIAALEAVLAVENFDDLSEEERAGLEVAGSFRPMPTTIQTLDGPLETADLGTVLMHEHIFNLTAEIQFVYPGFNGWDPEVEIPKAQQQLRELKEAGVDTMVELSPIGLGRNLDLIRRAAEGSGLNVVLATGLYTYDVLPRPWHFSGPGTLLDGEEPLDELMRGDFRDGIEGSGVKPGILKCAIDAAGLTEHVDRVVRSVIRIHRETTRRSASTPRRARSAASTRCACSRRSRSTRAA